MSLLSKLFGKAPARTVEIESSGDRFEVGSGATILERALAEGIAYPHDCTVGTCGSCRSRLISGKVEAITPFGYTLSREELDAGYILACQALPRSDLVLDVEIGGSASEEIIRQPAAFTGASELTHDIKRVALKVDKPIHYKAGQYANIHWGDGAIHRSYSFADAPAPGGTLEPGFFVRHVPGGQFTDRLFGGTLASETLEIDGPHGNFWLREGKGPILCIAGGSGLAPLLSLLQDAANRRVRRDCILLFGGRGARDLYAAEAIAAIRSGWTASFDYWPILSEEQNPQYRHGFVTAYVAQALERLGPGAQGYMCGPPPMIDAGIHAFSEAGIGLPDIHYDKFTDASTGA
ncbi:2Fe-2S iron-sulfur cluster binding domain-containing protein [Sphingopyxis sp. SE2]|uniref:2Fe-2S iron-sulfur cluster binding domain-containing protein n=1 Tax=Sphingopyxis sp. SE2 TaxID=1586240 RepID=UPI0028C2F702|nr:2Fe-2S iron-sulfur cluster binding domain-containing protein [Sphingopyxis sp. SE2]MDT7529124.1 2Fe-2S iron-sulfur cluster binding domain-containing protein [Sphingopyxis sp. SE2]